MRNKPKHRLYQAGRNLRANACVGLNGGRYGFAEYGLGYFLAARTVCEDVAKGGELMDLKIYPAVFLVRHGLELFLKEFITAIPPLFSERVTLKPVHTLNALWAQLKPHIKKNRNYFDRTKEAIPYIEDCIRAIEELDLHSMAFRYPVDKQWNAHVEGKAIHINYEVLAEMAEKLNDIFDYWSIVVSELNDARQLECENSPY
jgi:hypothetical protein